MPNRALDHVLEHIRHLALSASDSDDSDGRLLNRFRMQGDSQAFATLVQRYAGLVWGVCWRVLRQQQDAEDAFQAAFVVLARKAASIRHEHSVGGWLYEVAYHVALRASKRTRYRRICEREAVNMAPKSPAASAAWEELWPILDEELHQLPKKYRQCLVLCYLRELTHAQAARELGWPLGSMSRHLQRGRELLRARLARRGVVLPASLLAAALMELAACSQAPAALATRATQAALLAAAGKSALLGMSPRLGCGRRARQEHSPMMGRPSLLLTATQFAIGTLVLGNCAVGWTFTCLNLRCAMAVGHLRFLKTAKS